MSSVSLTRTGLCLRGRAGLTSRLQFLLCRHRCGTGESARQARAAEESERPSESKPSCQEAPAKPGTDPEGNGRRFGAVAPSVEETGTRGPRAAFPSRAGWESNAARRPSKLRRVSAEPWLDAKPSRVGNPELRGLLDDDFAEGRGRSVPAGTERRVGTEILFGVAPCSLAFAQLRRRAFRLFVNARRSDRAEVQGICQRAREAGVPTKQVSRKFLDRLCEGRVHQGVCLEVTPLDYVDYDRCCSGDTEVSQPGDRPALWLALEGILDPMNMGALLRSAYFLGADRVLTSQQNSCSLTPTVSKASAGTLEVMSVYRTSNLPRALEMKAAQGWRIAGTVGESTEALPTPVLPCSEFEWNANTVLVLGNEGFGLTDDVSGLCHVMLTIPAGRHLHAGIESLNVSVAAGILLHCASSKRTKG